jgi:hypothetical protein
VLRIRDPQLVVSVSEQGASAALAFVHCLRKWNEADGKTPMPTSRLVSLGAKVVNAVVLRCTNRTQGSHKLIHASFHSETSRGRHRVAAGLGSCLGIRMWDGRVPLALLCRTRSDPTISRPRAPGEEICPGRWSSGSDSTSASFVRRNLGHDGARLVPFFIPQFA